MTDPNTQAWLRAHADQTFGYPSIARFSWATVKVILEKGPEVKWYVKSDGQSAHACSFDADVDCRCRVDEDQKVLVKAFESAAPRDKGRSAIAKELAIRSVGDL